MSQGSQDMRRFVRELERGGWLIENGRHIKATPPWGGKAIIMPKTPSDHRALANSKASIRRAVRRHQAGG
jgi:hypothetical protein